MTEPVALGLAILRIVEDFAPPVQRLILRLVQNLEKKDADERARAAEMAELVTSSKARSLLLLRAMMRVRRK